MPYDNGRNPSVWKSGKQDLRSAVQERRLTLSRASAFAPASSNAATKAELPPTQAL